MKHILVPWALLVFALNAGTAQTMVTGSITDQNGAPLRDVNIQIQPLKKGTVSDRTGRFAISNLEPGSYDLIFTYIGFKPLTQHVVLSSEPGSSLQITMEPGELMLADVQITGQGNSGINTISKVDINLRPLNNSQDVLRMIPGLFIAQHAGGGKAEQIFLRGFDIDHGTDISLEVDGLPVNMVSHAHGQGYSDLHFLIPELIGTVDFGKGPYYADRGNLTTAGYVAFHTRNRLDENMVKVEGGQFGTLRNVNAFEILNHQTGDWLGSAYVASEYFRTDGYFDENQNFNRLNIMARYHANRSDQEAITIGFSTFNSRWDASGQIPERAVRTGLIGRFGAIDPTEGGETSRTNMWARHVARVNNGGLFENQLYYTRYNFNLVSNFTFFLNDPVNGDQITQKESRDIFGYKGSYVINRSLGAASLQTEIGGGFRYDDVNDIHLYRSRNRKQNLEDMARGDIDETNLYAYVSETLQATPRLSVNAAVRLDHFTFNYVDALTAAYDRQSVSKAVVSPKLKVGYQAFGNADFFVKGGIGFHSNDTRVVVAQEGREILPRAYGVDVGGNLKPVPDLLLHAAVWMLDLDQEFVYVGDEGIVEPSGKTRRQGVDVAMRYQVLPWLYADIDINLTKPRSREEAEGENHIPLAPTLTSAGGLSARWKNGLQASLRFRHLADRPANETNSVVASGYTLLDAIVRYRYRSVELSFSGENILDQEWNEAQFDTESRLGFEADPVSEIHFTPGTPLFFKAGVSVYF